MGQTYFIVYATNWRWYTLHAHVFFLLYSLRIISGVKRSYDSHALPAVKEEKMNIANNHIILNGLNGVTYGP